MTGVYSSTPHSYGAECGGRHAQPFRAVEHRVDLADGDLSVGTPVGVTLPAPGCSGLQLSR